MWKFEGGVAACIGLVALCAFAPPTCAQQSTVTAIDILLDPDAAMIARAEAANARLLKAFPKGFSLDAEHRPHITLLQRFVRTADLDKVYAAADKTLAGVKITDWKLTAIKYYFVGAPPIGLAGIVIAPTDDLLRLQQELLDAVAPFTVGTGTAEAFFTLPGEPEINAGVIPYVAGFVPDHTGKNYSPHVSVGVGTIDTLDKLLAEPFDAFTFSPVSASIYQLGDFGTARKKLGDLTVKP